MNNTTSITGGPCTRTTSKINNQNIENEQNIKNQQEIMKLTGEVAVLRQNIIALEKENYNLKSQHKTKICAELGTVSMMKKELSLLKTANRMRENQLRAFKRPRNDSTIPCTDETWILKGLSNNFGVDLLPFEYKRLEMISSFFLEGFERILEDPGAIEELENIRNKQFSSNGTNMCKRSVKLFCKFFILFAGKKSIFDHFFKDLIADYLCINNQEDAKYIYKVLLIFDLNWIFSFFEDKQFMQIFTDFLEETVTCMWSISFYIRIANERPFIMRIMLSKDRFNKLLDHQFSNSFLDSLNEDALNSYIDHTNIEWINEKTLKRAFKDDYFQVID